VEEPPGCMRHGGLAGLAGAACVAKRCSCHARLQETNRKRTNEQEEGRKEKHTQLSRWHPQRTAAPARLAAHARPARARQRGAARVGTGAAPRRLSRPHLRFQLAVSKQPGGPNQIG
jgi:hypothetical protein